MSVCYIYIKKKISMFSSSRSLLYHFACSLIITCTVVSSDDIPTMLWNIKGNALHIKPASALGANDKVLVESLKDIHRQDSSILVFAVNKLSLEDFSANDKKPLLNNTLHNVESFLDVQPYMLLPNVKDPLNYIHKAHCGVQEIVVDNKIDESIMQLVSSAIQRSCVVILHISDDGIVVKEDELKSVFLPTFENSNKDIVGIFTGVKSSWGSPTSDHHVFRNLLEVASSDDRFINMEGCIIMYAENITVNIGQGSNGTVVMPLPASNYTGSCGNSSSLLQLTYTPSGILSSVIINLNFTKFMGSWQTSGTISMTGEKALADEIDLNTESIGAALGFSYSCGDLIVKPRNSSFDFSIKLVGFQQDWTGRDSRFDDTRTTTRQFNISIVKSLIPSVQPYQVKEAVFSDSFDCVPFFTIPIWMGTFVSILFILIANIGIYALFSVHTMDRFDDPKGKTISVATTAD